MAPQGRTVDEVIAAIARRQHGVVTWAELRGAGLSADEIKARVKRGTLIRVFPGVYRAGHAAPSLEAYYLAAAKACGEGALLSGRAAAHLYGLVKKPPSEPEVTAPTERAVEGILTHRARAGIDPRDAATHRGIPITTPPRTIADIAARLQPEELALAVHEAVVRFRLKPRHIEAVLQRRPRTPGAGKLRPIIRGDTPVLLSELERRFQALLRREGLPLPQTNRPAGAHWVDCRWPEYKLTVELDSYAYHHTRHAWEQDRKRERRARARGDDFRRYNWGDVVDEPEPTADELRQLLSTPPS